MDKCPMCALKAEYDRSVENFKVMTGKMKQMFDTVHQVEEVEKLVLEGGVGKKVKGRNRRGKRVNYLTQTKGFVSAQEIRDGKKLCSACLEVKEANETNFGKYKRSNTGLSSPCRLCLNARHMEYVAKRKKGDKVIRSHSLDK